jgi:hypothetical protein
VSDDLLRLLDELSGGVLDSSLLEREPAPAALVRRLGMLWELDVGETAPASVFSAAWPEESSGLRNTRS